MKLPKPPMRYEEIDQSMVRAMIEAADQENVKRNRDYEVGAARIILKSPNGSRFALTVSNAGALSTTAL